MGRTFKIKPAKSLNCSHCDVRERAWFGEGSNLEIAERQALRSGEYSISARQMVYHEGQALQEVYTLRSGWLIRYKILDNGQRQVLNIALPGDFIAFRPNFDDGLDHSAIAASNITLCAFSRQNAKRLMESGPALLLRLIDIQHEQAKACHLRLAYGGKHRPNNASPCSSLTW